MRKIVSGRNLSSSELSYDESDEEERIVEALREFNAKFPTEKDCMEKLCALLGASEFIKCRYCGSLDIKRSYGSRVVLCNTCGRKTWITGGTFFHRIRTARPWLMAIYLMESGIALSSSKFHKLIGIAQSSALQIFKKITTVLERQMEERKIPSKQFRELFCKRSRETSARKHPVSEQDEIEMQENHVDTGGIGDGIGGEDPVVSLSGHEKMIYECLSSGPLNIDILSEKTGIEVQEILVALTMLELTGVVTGEAGGFYMRNSGSRNEPGSRTGNGPRNRIVSKLESRIGNRTGDEAVQAEAQLTGKNANHQSRKFTGAGKSGTKSKMANCLKYIRRYFHGVSRKYIQNYLAAYWCYSDRIRWSTGILLKVCVQFGQIDSSEILNYVSPLLVKMHEAALTI